MIEMVTERWVAVAVAAASVTAVAVAGGLLTEVGPWYEALRFPSWRPPNWLFGPAWTLIFLLIAVGGIIAWEHARDGSARLWLGLAFAINAILNVAWSALLFKLRRPDWALREVVLLWASIVVLVLICGGLSRLSAFFLAPYLAWVTFAAFLNWRVVELNKPFGTAG
jgi:benzodiazapine receptor